MLIDFGEDRLRGRDSLAATFYVLTRVKSVSYTHLPLIRVWTVPYSSWSTFWPITSHSVLLGSIVSSFNADGQQGRIHGGKNANGIPPLNEIYICHWRLALIQCQGFLALINAVDAVLVDLTLSVTERLEDTTWVSLKSIVLFSFFVGQRLLPYSRLLRLMKTAVTLSLIHI